MIRLVLLDRGQHGGSVYIDLIGIQPVAREDVKLVMGEAPEGGTGHDVDGTLIDSPGQDLLF